MILPVPLIRIKHGTYGNFGLNIALCPPSNFNSNLYAVLECKRLALSIADFLRADKTPSTSNSSLYNSFWFAASATLVHKSLKSCMCSLYSKVERYGLTQRLTSSVRVTTPIMSTARTHVAATILQWTTICYLNPFMPYEIFLDRFISNRRMSG